MISQMVVVRKDTATAIRSLPEMCRKALSRLGVRQLRPRLIVIAVLLIASTSRSPGLQRGSRVG